jgi:hypothetical protein
VFRVAEKVEEIGLMLQVQGDSRSHTKLRRMDLFRRAKIK